MRDPAEELTALKAENLYRELVVSETLSGERIHREGELLSNFASNDYLGLAQHEGLKEAACRAIAQYGVGSGSSRLISGTTPAHHNLEEKLASLKETQKALVFNSGFAAATGTIPALCGPQDTIILDKLCHACLIDGARASGARMRVFPHNEVTVLARLLESERARLPSGGRLLVIIESVYSMDGDLAELREMISLKEQYGALLLVDEAHALGVIGEKGLGLSEALQVQNRIDLQMGTLGKAAGGAGGYIACSSALRDLIVNQARSLIYSTARPRPVRGGHCGLGFDRLAARNAAALTTP